MVLNTRSRNTDNSKREDSRKGQIDRCEIINVRPHVNPYPTDKDYNTVDVQLVDRPIDESGSFVTIERLKLNCLQTWHGRFQGCPWHPRIGDLILVYWMSEREAVVLATIASDEQEPICRSLANDKFQEFVWKLAAWRQPLQDPITKNYVYFPPPEHPHCLKWWPVQADGKSPSLDMMYIWDCAEGHDCPNCSSLAPCNGLDDHQSSTCIKIFNQFSPTLIDKPWRFKIMHHCGSMLFMDEDGTYHLENRVAGVPRAHFTLYPDASVIIRSADDDPGSSNRGAYLYLAGKDGEEEGKAILENAVQKAQVVIRQDGDIDLTPKEKVTVYGDLHVLGKIYGAEGSSTGTGSQQQITHGLVDAESNPIQPGEVSAFCTGPGGSCTINYCTQTYLYVTCTAGVGFFWRVKR